MSTIPKPVKKRFYKRWWFWFLLIFAVIIILGGVIGSRSYKAAQLDSYAYLKEGVTVEKRDMKKTVSTTGTIVEPTENVESLEEIPTLPDLPLQEGMTADEILAQLDTKTVEKILDANKGTHIEFFASDNEVIDLEVGQEAIITIPSYDEGKKEFVGELSAVSRKKEMPTAAAAFTGEGTTETGYRITVTTEDLPTKLKQLIGLSVDLVIEIQEKKNVLTLEPGAVQYDDEDKPFVYLVPTIDEGFVARASGVEDVTEVLEKKYIDVGFQGDEYIEVTTGLKEGETVLLYVPSQGDDSGSPF